MRVGFLAIALFATPAIGQDFRALNLDQSCDGLATLEQSLGSKPIITSDTQPDRYAFSGQAFGHDAFITYYCPDRKLHTGNLFLSTQPLDAASETYRIIYNHLVSRYGHPVIDHSPLNGTFSQDTLQKDYFSTKLGIEYSTVWLGTNRIVDLALRSNGDVSASSWRVALGITYVKPH